MSGKKPNRLKWSPVRLPFELVDLLNIISSKHGYPRDQIHYFIYDLLKSKYPDDVERFADYLETHWLDTPPDE